MAPTRKASTASLEDGVFSLRTKEQPEEAHRAAATSHEFGEFEDLRKQILASEMQDASGKPTMTAIKFHMQISAMIAEEYLTNMVKYTKSILSPAEEESVESEEDDLSGGSQDQDSRMSSRAPKSKNRAHGAAAGSKVTTRKPSSSYDNGQGRKILTSRFISRALRKKQEERSRLHAGHSISCSSTECGSTVTGHSGSSHGWSRYSREDVRDVYEESSYSKWLKEHYRLNTPGTVSSAAESWQTMLTTSQSSTDNQSQPSVSRGRKMVAP